MKELELEEAKNIIDILEKKIRNENESIEMNCEKINKYRSDIQLQKHRMRLDITPKLILVTTKRNSFKKILTLNCS